MPEQEIREGSCARTCRIWDLGVNLWVGADVGGTNPCVSSLGEALEPGLVWAELSLSGLDAQVLPALFAAAEGRSFCIDFFSSPKSS